MSGSDDHAYHAADPALPLFHFTLAIAKIRHAFTSDGTSALLSSGSIRLVLPAVVAAGATGSEVSEGWWRGTKRSC